MQSRAFTFQVQFSAKIPGFYTIESWEVDHKVTYLKSDDPSIKSEWRENRKRSKYA